MKKFYYHVLLWFPIIGCLGFMYLYDANMQTMAKEYFLKDYGIYCNIETENKLNNWINYQSVITLIIFGIVCIL